MTAAHHLSEAETCLRLLEQSGVDDPEERSLLARATAHAAIAQALYLREIGDQLDRFPRTPTPADPADVVEAEVVDANPLHTAAVLLEWAAIGDEGDQRERTIARLMLHATGDPYAMAPEIAQHALDGTTGPQHYAVAQAIITLKIELPS